MKSFPIGFIAQKSLNCPSKLAVQLLGLLSLITPGLLHATPVHLRTEGQTNPLGIDVLHPAFAWQSDATTRDWAQSAYQITVATSAEALRKGNADVWDSGRRPSPDSLAIPYDGPALKPSQRYFWTVRVWDKQGNAAIATELAWWETGLLQPSDWQAKWIRRNDPAAEQELQSIHWIWLPNADPQHVPQSTTVEFEYHLHADTRPEAAILHLFTGGTYTTRVNGHITGHKQEWGAFDREDIRDQLVFGKGAAGDNTIAVTLSVRSSHNAAATYPAALAAILNLTQADGKASSIVSDSNWRVRETKPQPSTDWQPAQDLGPLASQHFGVAPDRHTPASTPDRVETTTALLRKDFTPRSKVVSARLYITALGSYQAFLNGKRVGQSVLVPDFTDYRKRVLYQTYDVTSLVAGGHNTLAAVLGGGWHGSPLLWSGSRLFPGPDLLRAQLELRFANGTRQTIATDDTWQAAPSPIVSSEIYGGEAYDARLDHPTWNQPSTKSTDWTPATVAPDPAIEVTAQSDLTVHSAQTITPVNVTMVPSDGKQLAVFDMGQNMVGVVKLRVHGPRGTTVRMQFAERLNPDGTVYTENLRDADATDLYTLSGNGEETWTPAFTFHGFRYIQVSGFPGKPTPAAIEGIVLNSLPAQPSIRLETSSDLLNHMNTLGLWGQRGNFLSIPTDCPQRDERMGWMGDAGVFWRTGSYNFDIDSFSHKFMQDVVDAQGSNGAFSDISPNLLDPTDQLPGAPGWGDAGVLVPYSTWLQYGDRALVERNWPAMQAWLAFILRTNPNYLRQHELGNNFADWLAPDPHSPSDLVATAYWALIAHQMEQMATALGRTADAATYRDLYTHIRAAYQTQYIHPDGSVEGNTQTAYVLTLYTGMAPKELEANMTERLVKDIEAHQDHLTTGFLGTPFLLSVLDQQGRTDVAYTLLLNKTYPSWGYMVEKGATTWWERWNGDTGDPSMNSYNHYAFGSVMAWVYRRAAGIDTDPASPGFHHIVIAPHVDARLPHVHAEYDSAYGTVATDWTRNGDTNLSLKVTIPANTTATVHLPATASSLIEQDGKSIQPHEAAGTAITEIGSGTYTFTIHNK
ncbi:alpha-L-rhamnosidase [Granulicella arctica]|uniref:alpha-L-rhamnosidase n=1 Tax=Granulicella arctica TaxID=940613 RepID=A0A7Y9TFV3_9BACT|nr:alpha-L-rhamnosidase [Granulicella arctica]NYF78040.1 alpha-L-rhamnosidase [Granulicella arctica]